LTASVSEVERPGAATRAARGLHAAAGRPGSGMPAVLLATAVLAVPFLVAVTALHGAHWVPTLDNAMTELRVRDVASADPPLIGLPGRLGTLAEQGSHPGPLSFWALWPVYRLLGSSPWSLQAATASLHVLAIGLFLFAARRRAGLGGLLGAAVVVAVLLRTYGLEALTEPWNPYLPLSWWLVFLVAVWSVVVGDRALLPVAIVAGSLCAQTHIPYSGLVGGMAVGLVALAAVGAWRTRRRPSRGAAGGRPSSPGTRGWWVASAVVSVVLWTPPLVDQLVNTPGNLTILRDHFTDPPEEAVGLGRGSGLLLAHLNPWRLLDTQVVTRSLTDMSQSTGGSRIPGAVVLVAWVAAVVVALRLRHRALLGMHAVLAAALLLGAIAMSRIFGFVWYYLMLWAWGVAALVLLSIVWTAVALVRSRLDEDAARQAGRWGVAALAGAAVVLTASSLPAATNVDVPAADLSAAMERVLPGTVDALGGIEAGGATYLVTWTDALSIGSTGYALLNELDRRGFDVGVERNIRVPATAHRVLDPGEATATVHLATGVHVERTAERPGYRRVAYADLRSPDERREVERLRTRVVEGLLEAGRPDMVELADENVFAVAIDTRVPRSVRQLASRMLDFGAPLAVFIGPPPAPSGAP
jgi:hypothetical protein